MSAREHFTAAGMLQKPKRPIHEFEVGRLMGEWQLSSSRTWSELTDSGHLIENLFQVAIVKNVENLHYLRVIVGPLCLRFAWI